MKKYFCKIVDDSRCPMDESATKLLNKAAQKGWEIFDVKYTFSVIDDGADSIRDMMIIFCKNDEPAEQAAI